MAEAWTIEAVETYYTNGGQENWLVHLRKPDGTGFGHMFPKETLEWRAAEYDIDPEDVETLLDIVLHEPHVDPEDTAVKKAGRVSPAMKSRGYIRAGQDVPTNLFNAATLQDAREAHLLRIRDAKENRVAVVSPKSDAAKSRVQVTDPLDVIRNGYRARPDKVAEKRQMVEERRKTLRMDMETAMLRKEA